MSSRSAARLEAVSMQMQGEFGDVRQQEQPKIIPLANIQERQQQQQQRPYTLTQIEQQLASGNGDIFPALTNAQIKSLAQARYEEHPASELDR